MIELGFAISIIILAVYIKKKKLKPSYEYVGDETGLAERAKEVIYNGIIPFVFPFVIAFNYTTGYLDKFMRHNNVWEFLVLTLILCLFALIISKIITRFAVKRATKKDYLKKYIGGIWIDTSK